MLAEAREVLRAKFLAADVGITGANFLVAETGTSIIVTNEGNGDLTQILPEAHIVIASLEKIVPTLEDAAQLLRVLARSATGQDASVYTTLSTGPRRPGDPDGPRAYHVVILDNGRSAMLGGEFEDMLRCIRCGACMNHCPVYQAVGGHAYGWVYPGPMGAVLTPSLIGVAEGGQLPNASTFCGRCEEVCPVRIPLPGMMRHWREREFERHLSPAPMRYGLGFWAFFASRPALYRLATGLAVRALHLAGRGKGRFASLPFAGGWTRYRDLAAPRGGARSRASGGRGAARCDEFPRGDLRQHSPLAWRHRRRSDAPVRGRNAPQAGAARNRAEARTGRRLGQGRDLQGRGRARAGERRPRSPEWADAPAEIARFLRESNCPATLRMGDDPRLAGMPWSETTLEILRGPSDGDDLNAVSAAFAGIAETGTLALVSGPDNPTTLNFLPDNHIVVLPREAIEADYESVFAKLRERLWQRRRAAHAQFHHRPLAIGRHRADPAARRAWAAAAAYRRRRLSLARNLQPTTARRINGMLIAAGVLPQRENFYSQLQ